MGLSRSQRVWAQLRHRRWRWLRRAACGLVATVLGFWLVVLAGDFPDHLLDKSSASSLVFRGQDGSILRQEASSAGLRENWVPLTNITPHLIAATLASEDADFHEHGGVHWTSLGRATLLNLRGRELAFGGSTITMQLVRLTAGTRRNLTGKLRQIVLAKRLERQLSKDAILEQYLNRVYYGNGVWGAQQASRFYFGKSAAELSIGEAALLAVFPRGPTHYDPFANWQRAIDRRDHILGLMHKRGYISADARDLAMRSSTALKSQRTGFHAPHFVEFVKERLPSDFVRATQVTTTLDSELQARVEVALESHVDGLRGRNLTQAAAVVLRNSDGAILAMVGSRDYHDHARNGAYNGVTARLRPGSTLKPFVYGAAMERGDTPASMALDVVLPEDAHQFYTKDVKQHGFARYREALAGSYNLSAVHTLQRAGIANVLHKLRTAGLATLDKEDEDYDWGLAIGHAEVRLLDLTAAFSIFGNGGIPVIPRAIVSATNLEGDEFGEEPAVGARVFSEEITYQLYDILSDADARKPMFGDRVPMNLPFKVALKTGTTKAYTDLWAIGATREYTVGVWAGNFDGSPTHQVMSLQGATPLVRAIYTSIASRFGEPSEPLRPHSLVSAKVCPLSGKRPGPHCTHSKEELFISGQVSQETCDWHQLACGEPHIAYPRELATWTQFYGLQKESACALAEDSGELRIIAPVDGATFVLEPHRAAESQRPPLAALPARSEVQWFIDDEPAHQWVPRPGTHTVRVARGSESAEITISYQ